MSIIKTQYFSKALDSISKFIYRKKHLLEQNKVELILSHDYLALRIIRDNMQIESDIDVIYPDLNVGEVKGFLVDYKELKNIIATFKKNKSKDFSIKYNDTSLIFKAWYCETTFTLAHTKLNNPAKSIIERTYPFDYKCRLEVIQPAIKNALKYVSKEEYKPYLCGVSLKLLNDTMYIVGVDGITLYKELIPAWSDFPNLKMDNRLVDVYDFEILLPNEVSESLLKPTKTKQPVIEFFVLDGDRLQLRIMGCGNEMDTTIITKTQYKHYPDFNQTIPCKTPFTYDFDRESLLTILQNEYKSENVYINIKDGVIEVLFKYQDLVSRLSTEILSENKQDYVGTICLNIDNLKKILNSYDCDTLTLSLTEYNKQAPLTFTDVEKRKLTLLMTAKDE